MPHSKMCKHCGGAEEDHHDYEPSMPDGCVCSPGEWGDVVTDPCEEYQGNGSEYCLRCEHDKACHKGSNAELTGRGTGPRLTKDASRAPVERRVRRVVCAAIRAFDGDLLLGIRHYSRDMHAQIEARRDGEKFKNRRDEDQGFVDQNGVFMTREEAYRVADEQGQIWDWRSCGNGLEGRKLYSEGLY